METGAITATNILELIDTLWNVNAKASTGNGGKFEN